MSSYFRRLKRLGQYLALISRTWILAQSTRLEPVTLEELMKVPPDLAQPILEDICLSPYVAASSATHDDLTPFLVLVRERQPRVVVELGTAYGNLAANICRQSPGAKVYTVNALPADQTGESTTYELAPESIGRVYRQYGFAERVTQIYQNTRDLNLAPYVSPASVDLAIIDACHDTDYVLNDFFKVAPFIQPQGLVLFHDTDPHLVSHLQHPSQRHLTGSYLACLLLAKQGYPIHHLQGTWWAVWSPAFAAHPVTKAI